ncbi:MAG TPA: SGNH hydrolase domain-containing protein [Solirubrobacterales bacterium]|nr:hypothetical protein [Solirubrobacterales bacterium]HMW45830.1 SGNH hydrolase domain-containing protein [Solirubrobacterales bacterium]HMX71343.1 SGNH hydrolase domain-containing protein [Solirubrobacterales bacterium]HMY27226.1 SGNH hydrolase domain-containing protein [Solirubrobacterales bacterium]HNA45506.1 SGNH hydrolase domain-containing protein [Solirubrobacterales bacterium]
MIKGVLAVSLASLLVLAGVARADQGTEWIPPLDAVARDKGEMAFDGCRPKPERIDPVMCVYGDPDSDKTIALFGDSHAMEWGPPLIRLAQRRGWRLVTFLRAGCVIADVKFQNNCDEWRELAFQEIAEQRPNRVIVSTSIGRRYTLSVRGETLSRTESEKILRRGMARTLKRLASIRSLTPHGTKVKLIRDQITAPFLPPRCLADHPDHPRLCRFPRKRKFGPGFDVVGASKAGQLPAIDPLEALCGPRWCYSSRGNIVIYRDSDHLTATFTRTLTDWLGERIGF